MEFKKAYINMYEYNDTIQDYENKETIPNPVALVRFAQDSNLIQQIGDFVKEWSDEEVKRNEEK